MKLRAPLFNFFKITENALSRGGETSRFSKIMYEDLIIAGFGGQGIIFTGKLLSYAGLREGKEVTFFPSYGAEMRGGTANCTVVVSDSPISSPIVSSPKNAIMMSYPSYLKFFSKVSSGGRAVINSSLVSDKLGREDVEVIRIPANEIAEEIGSPRIANMVILGAWIEKSGILSLESLVLCLEQVISKSKKKDLLSLNEEALRRGSHFVSSSG